MTVVGIASVAGARLPPLNSALQEAREAAAHFDRPVLLLNNYANRENIKREITRSVVFHFAGHSMSTANQAALLVADEGGTESSLLTADDIAQMNLRQCRLAVLSTCGAEEPALFQESRTTGFATAFLRAGAAAVVATKWNLDSETALQFSREFYRRLEAGDQTLDAFLAASRAVRQAGGSHPYYWAAYEFFGQPEAIVTQFHHSSETTYDARKASSR